MSLRQADALADIRCDRFAFLANYLFVVEDRHGKLSGCLKSSRIRSPQRSSIEQTMMHPNLPVFWRFRCSGRRPLRLIHCLWPLLICCCGLVLETVGLSQIVTNSIASTFIDRTDHGASESACLHVLPMHCQTAPAIDSNFWATIYLLWKFGMGNRRAVSNRHAFNRYNVHR